jgi:hypothetical protein
VDSETVTRTEYKKSQAAMEHLRSLHNMRKHYALYSRDENQEQMPY